MASYSDKLQKLYSRRNDLAVIHKSYFSEAVSMESKKYDDTAVAWKYAKHGMSEVSKDYTNKYYEEGKRIISQLRQHLSNDVDFRFQGSVTTRTNIRTYSDIDLLVITNKFYSLESGLENKYPYYGDYKKDLQDLRSRCISILKTEFPAAKVEPHTKAIKVFGGSLKRVIDIVPSNWYDTREYRKTNDEIYRGVQVFNSKENTRFVNYPFLLQNEIEKKDIETNGFYRKCVRLVKTLKCDSDSGMLENFSSYDIQSLFFYMNFETLKWQKNDFYVVSEIVKFLRWLIANTEEFLKLDVIDRTRKISKKVSCQGLKAMYDEFDELETSIMQGNKK